MNTLLHTKTLIGILSLVLILLVIPITLYLTQQEQDIRQEAAGAPVYSPPASYNTWKGYCYEETPLVSGLRGCVTQRGFNGKAYGWVRNTTTSQTFTVGMAAYKAYIPYPNPWPSCDIHVCPERHEWLWTQTYYDGVTATLGPGKTVYFEVTIPNCAWQTDVFKGQITKTFTKPNGYYGGQGNFIDGWYETSLPMCQHATPTPTRVPPTPTPTRVPPTPTPTPRPPTLSLSLSPTSVAYRGSTTLRWSTANATSCTASNAWSGGKSISGSQTISSLTSSRTFTLTCSGPGGSVTRSASVTVGSAPTPTPTRIPTPTPTPTRVPTPTPTPIPQATTFSLTVFMHGIGNSGDNANPTQHSLSNKNPLHKTRSVQIEVYNSSDTLVLSRGGTITYNTSGGNFIGSVDMGTSLSSGTYIIRIKSPQYLKKRIPGFLTITPSQDTIIPTATLVTGDINNDNRLSILDYNILIGCYSDFGPAISCNESLKQQSDLTDDGNVDQFDYNLFLRDFSVQLGD